MEFLSRYASWFSAVDARVWFRAVLTGVIATSGCATDGTGVVQYQDEKTAVTVTVATTPVVLAREVPMLAVNARDYLNLTAIEVNRTGQRRYYFFGYSWSTIDRREQDADSAARVAELVLKADDRVLTLNMSPREFETAGLVTLPLPPPGPGARPVLYPADRATLAYVGAAEVLSAEFSSAAGATPAEPYRPWNGSAADFESFLDRTAPLRGDRATSR
jgi:hypothetical protein